MVQSSFIPSNNTEDSQTVTNDGFYPDLIVQEFRDMMRADKSIALDRVIAVLTQSVISINRELIGWRQNITEATLAEVSSPVINGKTELVHLYIAAVYNLAKALLIENYRDYDSTKSGHDKAEQMETRIDDCMRVSRESIRAFLGQPRVTIDLI